MCLRFCHLCGKLDVHQLSQLIASVWNKKKKKMHTHTSRHSWIFTNHWGIWHFWSSAHNKTATVPFIISLQMLLIAAFYLMSNRMWRQIKNTAQPTLSGILRVCVIQFMSHAHPVFHSRPSDKGVHSETQYVGVIIAGWWVSRNKNNRLETTKP